ncbi:tRNA (cytidine(34)-2'-O)-methyltransferase [Candidatus Tiddalikarchaeum anstoanum]|nr:tRNA (cytidine(34)-2'-O)-methyltransferase [Candidatus Tiddalikarchaeum anstoanum]
MISVTAVGTETSGNLGAIARVMANFGVSKLYLVNPVCEVFNNDSKARAMHAYNILENAVIVDSLDKVSADYLVGTSARLGTGHNLRRVPLTPKMFREQLDSKIHYSIVLGREGDGLTNEELAKCDVLVSIPTKEYKAMNVSHALAVLLYELTKDDMTVIKHLANKSDRKAVMMRLNEAGKGIPNLENYTVIFENLMNRSFIRKKEARALAGLFKQLNEKINRK